MKISGSKSIVLIRSCLRQGRLPDVVLIGAQKAGTKTLFHTLKQHPQIAVAIRKEVNYFDVNHHRGRAWYEAHFRDKPGTLALDNTPNYIFYPEVPQRIADELPDARLLVLLRNPATRAYSHYQMAVDKGREPLSFDEALDAEDERINRSALDRERYSYRTRGLYADQLERWFSVFPRGRFHIELSEDAHGNPRASFDRICAFLQIDACNVSFPHRNARSYQPMASATRERLEAFFRPHNERLAAMLGRAVPW